MGSHSTHHREAIIRRSFVLRATTTSLALLVLYAEAPPATAQADAASPAWKASAELSLTDQSGNRDLRFFTGGLNVTHLQRERFRLDASARSRYGRSEGELVALSHNANLAFDLQPGATWSPFIFSDAERDEFKRLDLRLSSGGGAKYTAYREPDGPGEASISLALLHSYERLAPLPPDGGVVPPGADPATSHLARWSLRVRGGYEIRDGVTVRHTTFYQPVWDRMADYLLRSDTGLKVMLTERLALSVDYQLKRDARPPVGVEPDDRLLTTGLIIDF